MVELAPETQVEWNKNAMRLTKVVLTKLRHCYLNYSNILIVEVSSAILKDVEAYILVKTIG